MRCPSCEKFVSFDTEVEPEEQSEPELSPDGTFTATYRRVLTCADCGEELKEADIEFNENVLGDDLNDCVEDEEGGKRDHEWELGELNVEATMVIEGKGRGAKTFYGVHVTGTATCAHCSQTATIDLQNHEQASAFNELT